MDSKRKAFFNRIFGKNFWDFRKNQYYFYYLDGSRVYFENNVWYWDNKWRYWFKYLDSGKRIISRDDSGKIPHRL